MGMLVLWYKIGEACVQIRAGKVTLSKEGVTCLTTLGFVWEKRVRIDYGHELVYAACAAYKKREGHLNIPRDYVVPSSPTLDPEYRTSLGFPTGSEGV